MIVSFFSIGYGHCSIVFLKMHSTFLKFHSTAESLLKSNDKKRCLVKINNLKMNTSTV